MALDRLLARGVVFGACNVALQVQSKILAGSAGVSAEEAAKEWAANVVVGVTVIPSGTWGVNRAQEAVTDRFTSPTRGVVPCHASNGTSSAPASTESALIWAP
jgi:hypothetical protein